MKKWVLLVLLAVLLLPGAAAADEQAAQHNDTLRGALPSQAKTYLSDVDGTQADEWIASLTSVLQNAQADSRGAIRSALASLARVACLILLAAAARGFSEAAGGSANALIDMACALACALILLHDLSGLLSLCQQTLEEISVFSAVLQPVLAVVLSTGGSAVTATALQVATMLVFDVVIRLVSTLLVPAVRAYLVIVAVDAAVEGGLLGGLADGIKSLTSGALKLILTLFTAYLAVAGGVSGSVDRITLKTTKFALSGAVPVVGSVISDATETLLTGAALLRSSVGVFGMLCVVAMCVLPFVRIGAGYLCFKAGAAVLSPLCAGGMRRMLGGIGAGYGMLLGMLSTCCMILFLELVYVVAMVRPV